MAQQVLGRSIQSTFSFISYINSLFRPPPLLPPPLRVILKQSWPKSGSSQGQSLSTFRPLLSAAAFQGNAAPTREKYQELDTEEEEYQEFVSEEDFEGEEEDEDYEEEEESEDEGNDIEQHNVVVSAEPKQLPSNPARRVPELTVREKKELGAYAHSLGKKLKCQQVGKSGVTSSIVTSISEALEANELLKLKVHNTCPDEMDFVASQLQEATQSVVVGQIGRTLILYRPSLCKISTVEKKKPPQRLQRSHITKSAGRMQKNRRV